MFIKVYSVILSASDFSEVSLHFQSENLKKKKVIFSYFLTLTLFWDSP